MRRTRSELKAEIHRLELESRIRNATRITSLRRSIEAIDAEEEEERRKRQEEEENNGSPFKIR